VPDGGIHYDATVIHVVIFAYLLVFLVLLVLMASTFLSWRKTGAPFLGTLLACLFLMLADLVACFVLDYVSANVLGFNPLGITTNLVYFQRAPALYLLVTLDMILSQLWCVFFFVCIFRLVPVAFSPQVRFICKALIIVFMSWNLAASLLVPLFYQLNYHAETIHRLFRGLSYWFFAPVQIAAELACAVYWSRHRRNASSPHRWFGDLLLGAFFLVLALTVMANLLTGILPISTASSSQGSLLALQLVSRPIASDLLICGVIAWYLRRFVKPWGSSDPTLPEKEKHPYAGVQLPVIFCSRFKLTGREREITELLVLGLANKDIGSRLGISHGTVKNHVYNIFTKLGIKSRFELVAKLRENQDA